MTLRKCKECRYIATLRVQSIDAESGSVVSSSIYCGEHWVHPAVEAISKGYDVGIRKIFRMPTQKDIEDAKSKAGRR